MNVTALVSGGSVQERYTYDAYGNATIYNGDFSADADGVSDFANPIRFGGYWRDRETGLHHVRHRYYHARLGRWVQRDPLGYVDGMSLYEYALGNPLLGTDWLGLDKNWTWDDIEEWCEEMEAMAQELGWDEDDWEDAFEDMVNSKKYPRGHLINESRKKAIEFARRRSQIKKLHDKIMKAAGQLGPSPQASYEQSLKNVQRKFWIDQGLSTLLQAAASGVGGSGIGWSLTPLLYKIGDKFHRRAKDYCGKMKNWLSSGADPTVRPKWIPWGWGDDPWEFRPCEDPCE